MKGPGYYTNFLKYEHLKTLSGNSRTNTNPLCLKGVGCDKSFGLNRDIINSSDTKRKTINYFKRLNLITILLWIISLFANKAKRFRYKVQVWISCNLLTHSTGRIFNDQHKKKKRKHNNAPWLSIALQDKLATYIISVGI